LIAKRLLDLAGASAGLVLAAPLMTVMVILVWATMGRPVLFRQRRPGRFCRPFNMYKFRTMTDRRDSGQDLLPDHIRLTTLGRMMRATSMDELPELFNVIRGDMSLVGPRPLLMQYLSRYSSEQMRRHEAKPGLTGWAQIHGRNALNWEEKFKMDVWYVDHRSFALDLRIVAMTVQKVLCREGISQAGEATMTEFMGS
jgi:sugar transferase EpsL